MRKTTMIGQFDGKFTVSHAARLEPLVALSNTYFSMIPGATHRKEFKLIIIMLVCMCRLSKVKPFC